MFFFFCSWQISTEQLLNFYKIHLTDNVTASFLTWKSQYWKVQMKTVFLLSQGWTKPNAFHVCITSYKLVLQDHQAFRRKSWRYLILDEAQNIKNFKSQRWQSLLNFNRSVELSSQVDMCDPCSIADDSYWRSTTKNLAQLLKENFDILGNKLYCFCSESEKIDGTPQFIGSLNFIRMSCS